MRLASGAREDCSPEGPASLPSCLVIPVTIHLVQTPPHSTLHHGRMASQDPDPLAKDSSLAIPPDCHYGGEYRGVPFHLLGTPDLKCRAD